MSRVLTKFFSLILLKGYIWAQRNDNSPQRRHCTLLSWGESILGVFATFIDSLASRRDPRWSLSAQRLRRLARDLRLCGGKSSSELIAGRPPSVGLKQKVVEGKGKDKNRFYCILAKRAIRLVSIVQGKNTV